MPYFQPLLDLIRSQPPNDRLELIRELCEAVDAEHGERTPLLVRAIVDRVNPVMIPFVDIPPAVYYETIARLVYLGEDAAVEELVDWYEPPITFTSGRKERITETWAEVFPFFIVPPPKLAEHELDRERKRVATALRHLIPAHTQAVADEPRVIFDPSTGELPPGSFGTATFRPPRSVVLRDGIRRLIAAWMAIHQQLYDAAWQELGSKPKDRAAKVLALRTRLEETQRIIFRTRPDGTAPPQAEIEIPLARIRFGRSPQHDYLDAFPPFDSRTFGFKPYNRDPPEEPESKRITLSDLIRYRESQVRFLIDEYGEFVADPTLDKRNAAAVKIEKERKEKAAERRKLINQVETRAKSLRLDTEDELASFACEFFQTHVAATGTKKPPSDARAEAWNALIRFIELYLKTYTTHTEFNLDEYPPYFDRLFPRAINGGQLLDCGVYAVRMAYVFLSLADCIKSTESKQPLISFVLFPLHVGLIVDIQDFPTVIIHNDVLFRPTTEDLQRWRDAWDEKPESSDPTDPERLRLKFLEDVAGMMFCRDLDLPIARHLVSPGSTPPKKTEIWRAYEKLVVKRIFRLFSPAVENPTREEFQFDLRFLAMLTEEKRWYDANVVKFWNGDAHALWKTTTNDSSVLPAARRDAYTKKLDTLIKGVNETYKDVRTAKAELSAELDQRRRAVLGSEAQRITKASRLKKAAMDLGPIGAAGAHSDALSQGIDDVPGFSNPSGFISQYRE